ncbi:MAG: leucine-rich repeat domain-containing protein [Ruminococcus sp.]|uniref:leucine-rich repeat domain-containing protein n=1 Tax=Ruminococcus sp. TaxID=41978 RepID=UPI0025DEDC2A|nr:leucine-rich repeat domain-containing protein [Ruminococcus sp.]MCR5599516.1 leucine-rich repeat domain-containing protein [Ruminococcus sp.]
MKKINIIITAMLLFCSSGALSAYGAEKDGYEYTVIDGEVTVTGYRGAPECIEIPEFIESCPVTEIRDNAFYNCHSLRHISIPDTVLKIGHHSFYACYSLEEVTLPPDLEEIGMGCFCGCAGMTAVTIPETLTVLPDSCFRACTSLTEVTLPYKLEVIDKFCFAGCTSLSDITVGDSLTAVGERAFYMCSRLSSISLPQSCTSFGRQAIGYTCDGNMMQKQTNMRIYGTPESAAEQYAEENGLLFAEKEPAEEVFSIIGEIKEVSEENKWLGKLGMAVFGILLAAVIRLAFRKCRR